MTITVPWSERSRAIVTSLVRTSSLPGFPVPSSDRRLHSGDNKVVSLCPAFVLDLTREPFL